MVEELVSDPEISIVYVSCEMVEVDVVELLQPDSERPSPLRKATAQTRRNARERRPKNPPHSNAANVMAAAGAPKGLGGIFRALDALTNLRFPVVPVY